MFALLVFPADDLPRAVFPSSVGLPELPGILVGVFQKDSGVRFVDSGSGMSQAGLLIFHLALCSFLLLLGP